MWGLEATPDGGLAYARGRRPAENPLLAVMLARLKEGCRLLTDVGELDSYAGFVFEQVMRMAATR